MKNLNLTSLCLLLTIVAFGQQPPDWTQSMFNRALVNPAYVGSTENAQLFRQYRSWWEGHTSGAPTGNTFNFNMPIARWNSGIGVKLAAGKQGDHKIYEIAIAYAYTVKIRGSLLSMGIETGVLGYRFGNFWKKANNVVVAHSMGPFDLRNVYKFNNSAGVYYKRNNFYAGLASQQLTNIDLREQKEPNFRLFDLLHQHNALVGYQMHLNSKLSFEPYSLIRVNYIYSSIDLVTNFNIRNTYFFGTGYRVRDAMLFFAGIKKGPLRAGYSLDLSTSKLASLTTSYHEVLVSYSWAKRLKNRPYIGPL